MISNPLLAPVKEHLAFIRIEFAGNIKRAAEVVPKLVVVKGRGKLGQRVRVPRPGIRVQVVIAEIFVGSAVKRLGPGLGDNSDLGAGAAAVFWSVIRREDLDFLRRVHVGSPNAGAIGPGAGGRSAIEGDQVFRVARAVEVGRSLGEKRRSIG